MTDTDTTSTSTNQDPMRELFAQAIPAESGWTLTEGDKNTGQLIYHNRDTDKRITVPNIWYNQPVAWRIESMRFYAERAAESAVRLRKENKPWSETDACRAEYRQRELLALAKEMEKAGKVLA